MNQSHWLNVDIIICTTQSENFGKHITCCLLETDEIVRLLFYYKLFHIWQYVHIESAFHKTLGDYNPYLGKMGWIGPAELYEFMHNMPR